MRIDNVQGDVVLITDAPSALAQLLPAGFVENYLPGDMAAATQIIHTAKPPRPKPPRKPPPEAAEPPVVDAP